MNTNLYPEKKFLIKIYNQNNQFKKTLSPKNITTDIGYSMQVNGGQGEVRFGYAVDFGNTVNSDYRDDFGYTGIEHRDIVKIYMDIKGGIQGKHIYTGYISKIGRTRNDKGNVLEYTVLGFASIFNLILYKLLITNDVKFTKNDNPKNIIQDIVNQVNTHYPFFTLDSDIYIGPNINIEFTGQSCLNAIKQVVEKTKRYWYIGFDGVVYFKNPETRPNHQLVFGKDIEEIKIDEDNEQLYNSTYITYTGYGQANASDSNSITEFGLSENYEDMQDIQDHITGINTANDLVSKSKTYKIETTMTIISTYYLEILQVGDTISVKNLAEYDKIKKLKIQKIDYSFDRAKIYLENYKSLGNLLIK